MCNQNVTATKAEFVQDWAITNGPEATEWHGVYVARAMGAWPTMCGPNPPGPMHILPSPRNFAKKAL